MDKKTACKRRALRTRMTIKRLGSVRLTVSSSNQHIYAQIIAPDGGSVIASASTLDKEIKPLLTYGGNVKAAGEVGKFVATRALKLGIKKVAFDRAGRKYHGRVKALAEAAREAGLEF